MQHVENGRRGKPGCYTTAGSEATGLAVAADLASAWGYLALMSVSSLSGIAAIPLKDATCGERTPGQARLLHNGGFRGDRPCRSSRPCVGVGIPCLDVRFFFERYCRNTAQRCNMWRTDAGASPAATQRRVQRRQALP